jgi:hypothetical protein
METLSNLWYMMELNRQNAEAMLEKLVRRQVQEAAHIAIAVKVNGDAAEKMKNWHLGGSKGMRVRPVHSRRQVPLPLSIAVRS